MMDVLQDKMQSEQDIEENIENQEIGRAHV